MIVYCLNPACPTPQNPATNNFCNGCGGDLAQTTQEYQFKQRFRVTKLLGQGAFGRTYAAEDLDDIDSRPCVIKKFIAQMQGEALKKAKELFAREARQLKQFNHSQIPKLYAYFQQGNSLYLVQEYIPGENLYIEFLREGRFNEAKIRQLLQELLPVLQYLHNNNILHRDIKPENIMRPAASTPGRGKKLVLIDFGGAKQVTGTMLQGVPATGIYTPGYAAMEHILGQPCSASDLYSVGATCVRLLTGVFPKQVESGNIVDPLYDVGNACWIWRDYLQQEGMPISDELGQVLDKLVQTFLPRRYARVEEVLADLSSPPPKPQPQPVTPPPAPSPPQVVQSSSQLQINTFSFETVTIASIKTRVFGRNEVEYKRSQGEAEYFTVDLGNRIMLDMVKIPAGHFLIGSPEDEEGHTVNESPQLWVSVPLFFMGKSPVTQAQWQVVMGNNPSHFKGANRPVEKVSWQDCVQFCETLSQTTRMEFRLPSEAEWEYACRAGTTTPFHFGEAITTELANYYGNATYGNAPKGIYRKETTPVGSLPPNAFGLYDMHGNVREWCLNTWDDNQNSSCVLRGGSWLNFPDNCRSAARYRENTDSDFNNFGFRVVCVAP